MKRIIPFLFILIYQISFSQEWRIEKPVYEEIEKNIKTRRSNLFYKKLLKRYHNADSTMTLEEKRHLYYGYVFNKKYSPYSHSPFTDSLNVLFEKEELNESDLKMLIRYTNEMLKENPFALDAMNYQMYALEELGDYVSYNNRLIQMHAVVDALISSGNGKDKEEAFYVIYISHEYDLLDILGYDYSGSQSLVQTYDYLTVEENDEEIEGFYFEISPCLNSLSKMFK